MIHVICRPVGEQQTFAAVFDNFGEQTSNAINHVLSIDMDSTYGYLVLNDFTQQMRHMKRAHAPPHLGGGGLLSRCMSKNTGKGPSVLVGRGGGPPNQNLHGIGGCCSNGKKAIPNKDNEATGPNKCMRVGHREAASEGQQAH